MDHVHLIQKKTVKLQDDTKENSQVTEAAGDSN